MIACSEYSLPERIAEHVEMVTPTIQPNVKLVTLASPVNGAPKSIYRQTSEHGQNLKTRSINTTPPGSLEGCDTTIVPNCLKTLYNITYTPNATDRNTFGIGLFVFFNRVYSCHLKNSHSQLLQQHLPAVRS